MAIELSGLKDDQIIRFIHRVKSADLMAYLESTDFDNQERIRQFLSDRSRKLTAEGGSAVHSTKEGIRRAETLLEEIVAEEHHCLFCCIIEGKTPASFVHRGKNISIIMDIFPVQPGHMLVLPHQHADTLEDLPPQVFAEMAQTAQKCGAALMASSMKPDGFNLMIANGSAAGQEIFHPHMHILPRYHGDGLGMKFPEGYPQQRRQEILQKEADELAALFSRR